MLKRTGLLCAALLFVAPITDAAAVTFIFAAPLSGAQENPPNASPGTGSAVVTYDDVAKTLRVQSVFAGLLGNTTAAHIHVPIAFGANGPVATTVPTFAGFPLGVTSGTYDNTLDLTLASSYNPSFITNNGGTIASAEAALVASLKSGNSYFNLHSSVFPGGELRANLRAVPEPATWAMMIIGFGAIGATMRIRRRGAAATPA